MPIRSRQGDKIGLSWVDECFRGMKFYFGYMRGFIDPRTPGRSHFARDESKFVKRSRDDKEGILDVTVSQLKCLNKLNSRERTYRED